MSNEIKIALGAIYIFYISIMASVVHYGDVIFMTAVVGSQQVPLSGGTSCDAFYPSAETPVITNNIPDSFQIFNADFIIPRDSSGNPLPVFIGDNITIYNATSGMWWKQSHGYCLLDTTESEPITPFIVGGSVGNQAGTIQAYPYGSSSVSLDSIILTQNASGSGKRGSGLSVFPKSSQSSVLAMKTSSTQYDAVLTLWLPSTIGRGLGMSQSPKYHRSGKRSDGHMGIYLPILLGVGVLALLMILNNNKKK